MTTCWWFFRLKHRSTFGMRTNIACQPGVDVIFASNGDMGNFSGYKTTDPQRQLLFTQVHDAVLKAGKFLGAVTYFGKPGPPRVGLVSMIRIWKSQGGNPT